MNIQEIEQALKGKRILITGHAGFTGSWACLWLSKIIGANVIGYGHKPSNPKSLFYQLELEDKITNYYADVLDFDKLMRVMQDEKPEMVLHLAAQPLVRDSYVRTRETYETNVMGTVNVLEGIRQIDCVKTAVLVTTDKVYDNKEWDWPYRETDQLGGKDPYSGSKSAAEMVIKSYRGSIFTDAKGEVSTRCASVRGGNIVGGGDWSKDRLIPDIVRAIMNSEELKIRYPNAVRPWQHVLGLIQGYLTLLVKMMDEPGYATNWNFGPIDSKKVTVGEIVNMASELWGAPQVEYEKQDLFEAGLLMLDSSLAVEKLKWSPPWDTEKTIEETIAWYKHYHDTPNTINDFTLTQIQNWKTDQLKDLRNVKQ